MVKMYFNEYDLKYKVVPKISSASERLNIAYREMFSMNIPDSFAYKTKLAEFINDLKDYVKNLNDIEEYINKSCNEYKLLEDNNKVLLNMISYENIKARESIIRKNLS